MDKQHQRIANLEESIEASTQSIRILKAKLAVEEGRIDVASADLDALAPNLRTLAAGEELSDADMGENEDERAPGTLDSAEQQSSRVAQQSLIAGHQKAVEEMLDSLYRVTNFKNIADKHYPHVPETHEDWPHSKKPDGGRENHMRFDFEHPWDAPVNSTSFDRLKKAVREQGHTRVAGAAPYLQAIDDRDREAMKGVPIPTKVNLALDNTGEQAATQAQPPTAEELEKDLET